MNFVSYPFVLFFMVTFLLFLNLPHKFRVPLLLAASYLFYATWSIPFIGVILLTTTFDFWMSRFIAESKDSKIKKTCLVAGLTVNLLILFYFKYANFFLDTAHSLIQYFHWPLHTPRAIDVILPLGISFYTFEAISYMVDVYRGEKPAKNWLDYNFYIMYFPHLISGPIVRFRELSAQYAGGLTLPSVERISKGFELIVLGYLFKVLLADQAALYADALFLAPDKATVLTTYLGVLGFTVQIYFDFMGYTHIARGASLFFNLEMPLNFNHPYNAGNISDFWNRWHMSLSRWIRDYLYFPLGGSRLGLAGSVNNLMLTMLICGLWHGAGWTFLVWGGYHGLLLSIYHVYKQYTQTAFWRPIKHSIAYGLGSTALTFVAVMLGWVFFRATDFQSVISILGNLSRVDLLALDIAHMASSGRFTRLGVLITLFVCCFSGPWVVRIGNTYISPMPYWLKMKLACLILALCWIFSGEGLKTFIYFQF